MSSEVLVAIVSTIGGVTTTYLTVKYKDRLTKKNNEPKPPKDRMDSIFDGYERLIVQLTSDMNRKESSIQRMEGIINQLEEELAKTKKLLEETKADLLEATKNKRELSQQLLAMKKQYLSDEKLPGR